MKKPHALLTVGEAVDKKQGAKTTLLFSLSTSG